MSIMTVNGRIDKDDLGVTDMHEHVFFNGLADYENSREGCKGYSPEDKVSIENLSIIGVNPIAIKDNMIILDERLAENELMEFKRAGGKTIVDLTTFDIGRNPIALRRISNALNLNIITTTGYYREKFHPPKVKKMTVEELSEEMIREIEIGIDDTDIKAGIIGELGTSETILPNEKKVLIAAAKVNKKLGTPIAIHIDPITNLIEPSKRVALEVLEILSKNGANLGKVYFCHMDCDFYEFEYYKKIIKTGAYIGFDAFGEVCISTGTVYGAPSDGYRVKTLLKLIDKGYIEKILIGNDTWSKAQLHKYGGFGYDHFLSNIVPFIKKRGSTNEQLNILLVENPKRFLNVEG